jgi:hypothetical protein
MVKSPIFYVRVPGLKKVFELPELKTGALGFGY